MDFEMVKLILGDCVREELRDHAFGDVEIHWMKDGVEIASGYFGGRISEVSLTHGVGFVDDEARALRECGMLGAVQRNDETGPDNFVVGHVMPSLTKEAVFKELTEPN